MMDPITTFFLAMSGAMLIIIITLWIFKLPPFDSNQLGRVSE